MQALWRMRPHASRSATAPGSLPISEVPALLLRTATTLGGANVSSLRRQWSELPPRSQSHVLASGAESGGARRISAARIGTFFEYRRAAKRETIDLCHWRGHPTPPLCSSGARLTWLCGNHNHSSSTQCGCVAVADWRYRSGGYGKGGIPGFSAFQNWASRIHSNVRFKSSVECARAVMRLYASSKQCWRPQSSFRWRSFPMPAG